MALTGPTLWLAVTTAVLAGVVGGVFFAFSSFVMPALERLAPAQGIAAMQAINVTAVGPSFMAVFLAPGVLSVALIVLAVRSWAEPPAPWLLAGGVLYLVGIVITMGWNVPRNERLAALDPSAPASVSTWADFVATWSAGNHARAATSVAAATCLLWSVHVG